jgi:PH domain/leucine-rich repeat-containing protein phosphatase
MCNRLKILNLSGNRLSRLPSLNNDLDLNRVEELYLSRNQLGNDVMEVVSGYSRLRVLHVAYNEINEIYDK